MPNLIPQERIETKILVIRGVKVMLDRDLAELYEVPTRRLNEQVNRNGKRFPQDFMFQLTRQELINLKSHFATSRWGGTRKLPRVFTEHGILMLSSVLNSNRAIQVNIQIMRIFMKLREMALSYKALQKRIDEMESKYDKQFKVVFDAIRQLLEPPHKPSKRILGFRGEKT